MGIRSHEATEMHESDEPEGSDLELLMIGSVDNGGKMPIYVSINSWNGGEPKLAIIRRGKRKNGEFWYKAVGRMTEGEASGLIQLLAGKGAHEHGLTHAFELAKKAAL